MVADSFGRRSVRALFAASLFVLLSTVQAFAQIPIPHKYVPDKLEILDEQGNPVTTFDPVELTYPPDSVSVTRRNLRLRLTIREIPPQDGTYFVCDTKPDKARFRIQYDVSNLEFTRYYSRSWNSLAESPFVFDKDTGFAGNLAEVSWDGRDTSSASRVVVRGTGAKYFTEVQLDCCGDVAPFFGGSIEIEKPNATVIGNAYPDDFLDIVFHDSPEGAPGVLDGFTGLAAVGGILEEIGPESQGYDTAALRNTKPDVVAGAWGGSAVFAWFGHSHYGNYLVSYSGLANGQDKKGETKKFAGMISPLVGMGYKDNDTKKAGNGAHDFPASMADSEFVLLGACWSARPMTPAIAAGKSMLQVCIDRGADVAVGWVGICDSAKGKDFLKTLVEDQASVGSAGEHPSLDSSLDVALDKIGVPHDGSVVKILHGTDADPDKISFGDLPRFGRK
jgi:hypothetical protein